MRGKYEYLVDRDDNGKIIGRTVQITLTGKDAEKQFEALMEYIEKNTSNEFARCPFEEGLSYGDNVTVLDWEEAEEIKYLYNKFKKGDR